MCRPFIALVSTWIVWCSFVAGQSVPAPAASSVAATSQSATASSPATRPVAYLSLAVPAYVEHCDPLVADAALRLTAMRLAARYGIYAQLHPSSEPLADEAYPRVEIQATNKFEMPCVRLTRKGDVFLYEACSDGEDWTMVARYEAPLKKDLLLGFMNIAAWNFPDGSKDHTVTVSDFTVNGQKVQELQQVEVGALLKPSRVLHEDGKYTLETFGQKVADRDFREAGPFLFIPVQGDFVASATIRTARTDNSAFMGMLCCREDTSAYCGMTGVISDLSRLLTVVAENRWHRMNYINDPGAHQLRVMLQLSDNEGHPISRRLIYSSGFEQLTKDTQRVSDDLLKGLQKQLSLDLSAPRAAYPATAEQSARLSHAHELAATVRSSKIWQAGGEVDEVLNASPTCAEAHYVAAFCGAMLSLQDVYGMFQQRSPVLAGPLAHLLMAQELSPPANDTQKLTAGWVAYVCGYPMASLEAARHVAAGPESRALEVLVTRDSRPIDESHLPAATALEQLAWKDAMVVAESPKLEETPGELAQKQRNPALLPVYAFVGVGPDHMYTVLGVSLAAANDLFSFLLSEDLPAEQRREALRKSGAPDRVFEQEWQGMVTALATNVLRMDDEQVLKLLPALVHLYEQGLSQPTPPYWSDGRLKWRCIGLRDFAQVQRGFLLRMLYNRADFIGQHWGVSQQGRAFALEVARCLECWPEYKAVFLSLSESYIDQNEAGRKHIQAATRPAMGVDIALRQELLGSHNGLVASGRYKLPPGRGCWEWARLAQLAGCTSNNYGTYALLACQAQPYSLDMMSLLYSALNDDGIVRRHVERMSYLPASRSVLAGILLRQDKKQEALEQYLKLVEEAPRELNGYWQAASIYRQLYQDDQAIAIVKRASECLPDTVGKSNLLGDMAYWLVEAGRYDEALHYGQLASESYSYRGLAGYAVALEANGKLAQAEKQYRNIAMRYESGAGEIVGFLLRHGRPAEDIQHEVDALLQEHATMRNEVICNVAQAFIRNAGDCELLEQLIQGPLKELPEPYVYLMKTALARRDAGRALQYARQVPRQDHGPHSPTWIWALRRACKEDQEDPWLREYLKEQASDGQIAQIAKFYLDGAELGEPQEATCKATLLMVKGCEAERQGRMDEAMGLYCQAKRFGGNCVTIPIVSAWLDQLAKPATTRPASGPASVPAVAQH